MLWRETRQDDPGGKELAATGKTNARSRRTRRQLREAVLALAEREDLANIGVNDITAEAGLNRTTFYLHYAGREAAIADALAMLIEEMSAGGLGLIAADDPIARRREGANDTFFREIGKRPELFRRLLRDQRPGSFADRLHAVNATAIIDLWRKLGFAESTDGPPWPVLASYAAMGLNGIVLAWLDSGMAAASNTVADWTWDIVVATGAAASAER